MKHLVPCIVLVAAVLGSAVEAFFLGPTAVGVGAGAVSYRRGHSLGYTLGQSRTYSRGGNSYNSYSRSNHYHQTNNYYSPIVEVLPALALLAKFFDPVEVKFTLSRAIYSVEVDFYFVKVNLLCRSRLLPCHFNFQICPSHKVNLLCLLPSKMSEKLTLQIYSVKVN